MVSFSELGNSSDVNGSCIVILNLFTICCVRSFTLCSTLGNQQIFLQVDSMAAKGKYNSFTFALDRLTDEQAQSKWLSLKTAIGQIQQGNASKLRYEDLYR